MMKRTSRNWTGLGARTLLGLLVMMSGACAQGELEEPEPTVTVSGCSSDEQCPEGLRCNAITGECVEVAANNSSPNMGNNTSSNNTSMNNTTANNTSTNNTTANNTSANNMAPNTGNNTSSNNTSANNMAPNTGNNTSVNNTSANNTAMMDMGVEDMDPNACNPMCGPGEECVEGMCTPIVLDCDPACGANEECVQGTCVPIQTGQCTPECPETETCENGTCVPAVCDPPCASPGVCTVNGCQYPSCQREGDACDSSMSDQGNFWCLLESGQSGARCFTKCPRDGSATGCATGQRCLAAVQSNPSILICIDSFCATDSDCTQGADLGTCIRLDNDFGFCEPAGPVSEGGACNLSTGQYCQQGLTCDTGTGSSQGTCAKVCDPWTGAGCGLTEACAMYTNRTGVCTTDLDPSGLQAFDVCDTPGAWCDDATLCLGGGANNICYQYCRPGTSDCGSVSSSTCNNYIIPGDRTIGLCDADCSLNPGICGSSFDCLNGICRRRCTTQNVTQDCCGGSTPCNWQCVSGYCE